MCLETQFLQSVSLGYLKLDQACSLVHGTRRAFTLKELFRIQDIKP